jgi:HD-GYP domain-containing protein (c-di-GMP phosphodiesterase class II)
MDGSAARPEAADNELAVIRTPDELALVVEGDARFHDYTLKSRGEGFVEVGFGIGGVVFAWPELWRDGQRFASHLTRARSGYSPLVLLGDDETFLEIRGVIAREQADIALQPMPVGIDRAMILLRNYRELCRTRREAAEGELLADRYQHEIDEINAIGRALSSERNLQKLLSLILEKAREITVADAGSIYVVEGDDHEDDPAKRTLRFKVSQNDSVHLDFTEFTLPVSEKSIVGRCVLTKEVINITDLYRLDEPGTGNNPWGFRHNREFDEKIRYQTRSMLTVPMIDAKDQVIGVIQLINRKRRPEYLLAEPEHFDRYVIAFDPRSQNLARTLASQAGIALENALLYEDIRGLFEGFVHASVAAIESRDPTTSGHSQRVADLTVGLAKATDREESGPYAPFAVSWEGLKQIEYAALLHDFGKVGVRENVLVKAKKLYDHDRELILARFEYVKKSLEADLNRRKVTALLETPRDQAMAVLDLLDDEYAARIGEIDEYVTFILKANEPTVLEQGGFERLADIAKRTYRDGKGEERPYLRTHEVETLQILRGSLTTKERIEIESHVSHTYAYLKKIPWGRAFRDLAEIAGSHHEKLDGTGYPRRLKAEDIPAPARMMAISDIYDALTASDRPYKKAVPAEKALDIIGHEVKAGKLDAELYRIFLDAKIWQLTVPHPAK